MKFSFKSEKGEKIKKALIIALPIVFALTAAVALALLMRPDNNPATDGGDEPPVQNGQLDGEGDGKGESDGTKKDDVDVVAPVETPPENLSSGLRFRPKGNGTCAVVGIGDCSDRVVVIPNKSPDGDIVVEIAVGAFADCRTIVDVTIPDSVVSIGTGAFSGCSNLESVTVGDANPLYSSEDGVLFNKAKSTLLLYPAGKRDEVYVLPKSVTRIGEGAFASARYLVEMKFLGTKSQWQAIYVAPGNAALDGITITCSSNDK